MTPENSIYSPQADGAVASDNASLPPSLSLDPLRFRTRSGALWLKKGFFLYLKNAGTWMLALLVMVLVQGALFFFPVIGPVLPPLLLPMWLGGLILGCVAVTQERNFHFRHLFTGFEANGFGLLKLGLFAVVAAFIAGSCAALIFGTLSGGGSERLLRLDDPDVVAEMAANPALREHAVIAAVVFLFVLAVPAAGLLFSPALVVLKDVGVIPAIKASFFALLRNLSPILVWLLLVAMVIVVLLLPVMLLQPWQGGFGLVVSSISSLLLFVLLPVLITSIYCMSCDVFPVLRWKHAAEAEHQ